MVTQVRWEDLSAAERQTLHLSDGHLAYTPGGITEEVEPSNEGVFYLVQLLLARFNGVLDKDEVVDELERLLFALGRGAPKAPRQCWICGQAARSHGLCTGCLNGRR